MNTLEVSACFPIDHLEFAAAWAAVAPGGWGLAIDPADEGEAVSVYPPGCDLAVFTIGIENGAVETWWHHHVDAGGRIENHGSHATLRQAVLALCPLSKEQLRDALKVAWALRFELANLSEALRLELAHVRNSDPAHVIEAHHPHHGP